MASQIRQNFHEESEAALNKQINWELYASYVYMSMAAHYRRDDISLPGFAKFFAECSEEEREHAQKLIKYQTMRGGRVVLNPIDKPSKDEWGKGIDGMIAALDLEKTINQSLLDLHKVAEKNGDPQMQDYLEGEFLKEQVEAIEKIGNYITQLKRCGDGLGEWEFDRKLQS